MMERMRDVADKGWRYSLAALAEPARMPFLAWNSAAQKAHLGELLKLNEHRQMAAGGQHPDGGGCGRERRAVLFGDPLFCSRGADLRV